MSAKTVLEIRCDGMLLGLICVAVQVFETGTSHEARATLKRMKWTRPGHVDRHLDLCPTCTKDAVLKPIPNVGRPKKVKA